MPSTVVSKSNSLTIAEMVRVLDVASEVRRKQEVLAQQWNIDAARDELREKLRATQLTTGEELSSEQIDTAIDWYYDRLHRFRYPKPGLGLAFAHLYVRRGTILKWTAIAIAIAGLLWWFFM